MHLDACQFFQDGGRIGKARPVVLDILTGGEVAIATIVLAGNVGQHPHLPRVQRSIGDCNAQHVGMQLEINAVHQTQWLERIFGQLTGQAALHLIAKLLHATFYESVVELVITVHDLPQTAINAASAGL